MLWSMKLIPKGVQVDELFLIEGLCVRVYQVTRGACVPWACGRTFHHWPSPKKLLFA